MRLERHNRCEQLLGVRYPLQPLEHRLMPEVDTIEITDRER
jgi:hypothetical protein